MITGKWDGRVTTAPNRPAYLRRLKAFGLFMNRCSYTRIGAVFGVSATRAKQCVDAGRRYVVRDCPHRYPAECRTLTAEQLRKRFWESERG